VRRYLNQKYWEKETADALYSEKIDSLPRIESLADHSWHVADIVLLVGAHFTKLDLNKCVQLAVLHDKLELIMGDKNPLGRDGTGLKTHAFNPIKGADKLKLERLALDEYTQKLGLEARAVQSPLFQEILDKRTPEALFVSAIDKLQPLTYILAKKRGALDNEHILFTLHYSHKSVAYFPSLFPYYKELTARLLSSVSRFRKISRSDLLDQLEDGQMPLFL